MSLKCDGRRGPRFGVWPAPIDSLALALQSGVVRQLGQLSAAWGAPCFRWEFGEGGGVLEGRTGPFVRETAARDRDVAVRNRFGPLPATCLIRFDFPVRNKNSAPVVAKSSVQ